MHTRLLKPQEGDAADCAPPSQADAALTDQAIEADAINDEIIASTGTHVWDAESVRRFYEHYKYARRHSPRSLAVQA